MNILFADVETTGKPKNYKAHYSDVDNWPRVIQLAFQITDDHDNELFQSSNLIYPEGWEVPKEEFFIAHDLSTEKCEAAGIKIATVLDLLVSRIDSLDVQIAVFHNAAFDFPVMAAEMVRCGKKTARPLLKVCTMEAGVNVCKIPFGNDHRSWKNKEYKWPKLTELHQKLFGEDFSGAHDAQHDVTACRKCFFKMLELGHINLPIAV